VKAISLWEPYASLVRTGAKTWETRSWATKYRGPLLICAAKKGISVNYNTRLIRVEKELVRKLDNPFIQEGLTTDWDKNYPPILSQLVYRLNFGMATAIIELVDCVEVGHVCTSEIEREQAFGDFSPGRYAWKLRLIDGTFEPFPVKGRQGIFEVKFPQDED